MQYEDNVIGVTLAILNNADEVDLAPKHFSSHMHAKVWKMMQDGSYDIVEAGKTMGDDVLADCIRNACTSNMNSSVSSIKKAYNFRMLSTQFDIALKKVESGIDVSEAMQGIDIQADESSDTYSAISGYSIDVYNEMADRDGEDSSRFIPTGIREFDKKIGGLERTTLVLIAARPSMGKTSLMMDWCLHIAKNHNVVINSIEMDAKGLCYRSLSSMSNLNLMSLRTAKEFPVDVWRKTSQASSDLSELNLFIDDNAEMSASKIAARAISFARGRQVDVIAIDYIGLLKPELASRKRHEDIGEMTRVFKKLAKKLNCCVLLLSQLNRDAEGIKPNPSHLRESGSLEQDADLIVFPYRHNKNKSPIEDALLVVGKNRNGPIGDIEVLFESKSASFKNKL